MKLIRVLTGLTIVGIGAAFLVSCQSASQIKTNAESELAVFAQQAGMTPVSCVGVDTDGNWRVGCTAKDGNGNCNRSNAPISLVADVFLIRARRFLSLTTNRCFFVHFGKVGALS
jgi:hypothetical protein